MKCITISKRGLLNCSAGVYYSPTKHQILSDKSKQFTSALKNYLSTHFCYSIDEYFNVNREW